MKIAITGGRDYVPVPSDFVWFGSQLASNMHRHGSDLELIHGAARGVDTYMSHMVRKLDIFSSIIVTAYPALWEEQGKVAGFIRNNAMAEACDLLLAFPGGNGTQHMVDTCRKLGKEVHESPTRSK